MKRFAPLLLGLLSLAFSLVVVEVCLRIYLSLPKPEMNNDRPVRHYLPEKSGDNRDYWYFEQKPPHTFRIAVIGDSFTYGFGNFFDDAYPKRLERLLNLNEKQTRVEVMNFGEPGFSTAQEVQVVRDAVEKFSPDLVLLQITLNDPELRPFQAPRGVFNAPREEKQGLHLRTWELIASRVHNSLSHKEYVRYYNDLFLNPESRGVFHGSLTKIKQACDNRKVPVIAMVFPLLSFPFGQEYPFHGAHKIIHEFLQELHIPFLDLLPAFHGMDPLRLQVVPPGYPHADPHPNEIAHRIAAETLYRWLVKHQLLPKDAIARCSARKREGPMKLKCRDDLE